jgi:hypothetical protein
MSRVLVFIEDPGAANYALPLLPPLGATLWTAPTLLPYLEARGVRPAQVIDGPTTDLPAETELLLIGTSENLQTAAHDLVRQAKARGIPSVGMIDFPANAAARFRGETRAPLAHAPDWLLVTDDGTARHYEELGFPADKIGRVGHPHFDTVLALREKLEQEGVAAVRRRLLPEVPEGQKLLVFLSEISGGLDPEQYRWSPEYSLDGRGGRDDRTGIVVEAFLDVSATLNPHPYRLLRLHPKNTREEFGALLDEFDGISQAGTPLEMVFACDLVCGMTTMLLYEAALLGRPTLAILPRAAEGAWLPTIASGVTPAAITRPALSRMLPALLNAGQGNDLRPEAALPRALAFLKTIAP